MCQEFTSFPLSSPFPFHSLTLLSIFHVFHIKALILFLLFAPFTSLADHDLHLAPERPPDSPLSITPPNQDLASPKSQHPLRTEPCVAHQHKALQLTRVVPALDMIRRGKPIVHRRREEVVQSKPVEKLLVFHINKKKDVIEGKSGNIGAKAIINADPDDVTRKEDIISGMKSGATKEKTGTAGGKRAVSERQKDDNRCRGANGAGAKDEVASRQKNDKVTLMSRVCGQNSSTSSESGLKTLTLHTPYQVAVEKGKMKSSEVYNVPLLKPFLGQRVATRRKRSLYLNVTSAISKETNTVFELILMNHLKDEEILVFHDGDPASVTLLNEIMNDGQFPLPLMVFDISELDFDSDYVKDWLGLFNDPYHVHIVLFSNPRVVENFSLVLPERLWTPNYLILFNINFDINAKFLLELEAFGYSPFLVLIQLDPKKQTFRFSINTLESFRPRNKVVTTGYYYPDGRIEALSFDSEKNVYHLPIQTLHPAEIEVSDIPDTASTKDRNPLVSIFPDRFHNFNGHRFHLASWSDDFPYMIPGKTLQEAKGISTWALREIGQRLNFTFEVYHLPEDGLWGDFFNGSWRGMLGELVRREKDLCINVMSIVHDRYLALDFSTPYFTDSYSFVLPIPDPPPRWHAISFPFTWHVWLALLLTLLVVPFLLVIFSKVEGSDDTWDVDTAFLRLVQVLLRQADTVSNPSSPIRLFVGVWWLWAMIVSTSYTGNLIAFITVPAKPEKILTLKGLAESSITPKMLDYGNFVPGALKISQDRTHQSLGEQLVLTANYDEPFHEVNTSSTALLEGTEYLQYLVIKYRIAGSYYLPEVLYPIYVGFMYQKKTPWKHKLDPYLQSLVESGLLRYWKQISLAELRKKYGVKIETKQKEIIRPLSLTDMQGAFIIYGMGLAASVIVMVFELLIKPAQN